MSLLFLMYQINREKELLFVFPSLEKERQETCVSAFSDVSDKQIYRKKELLFVFLSMEKESQETCVSALSDVSDR